MRWHPFSEVIIDVTSKFSKIKASDYKSKGGFKIIDQGQKEIAGYTDDESLVNKAYSPIIVFGDHTRAFKYEESPIALGADGAKALSVNSELANILYVYYYLRTVKLQAAGYSRHYKFLKEIKIPIPETDGRPDLDEQKRIACLLGKVEGLITQRKQHLTQLDDFLKSVFLEVFGDPVRNEKGWVRDRIGKSTKVQGGYAFKSKDLVSKGAVRLVKIANVHFEKLIWDDVSFVPDHFHDYHSRFALYEGDLLIALTRPVIKSLDVVKTATVRKNDLPCLLNQRVARFVLDENQINKKFLLQYCYTQFFKDTIEKLCPPGLQPNISTNQIEDIPIYYPPIDLQNQFATIFEKVEGIKTLYQQSLTDLESLYGGLSQKAFKGELDLSRVPLPQEFEEKVEETLSFQDSVLGPESAFAASPLPQPNDLDPPDTPEGREGHLQACFNAYLEQLQEKQEAFSMEAFLQIFQNHLESLKADAEKQLEYSGGNKKKELSDWIDAFESNILLSDYESVKDWLFQSLEQGRLKQSQNITGFDENGKPILGNTLVLEPAGVS